MTLGSLFDGSGGFPLAGMINGIQPVWASEVEAYPIRVTSARIPCMKHLGDVTKINGAEIEPVDVITFGSPCQDLSVAGAQKGIHEGERSSLFFEAVRIIKEMRASDRTAGRTDEHVRPRFAVWENVPGAFSSNAGRDFQAVLQALCGVCDEAVSIPEPPKGKWAGAGCIVGEGYSVAWRVYDAQYWGVPQRRKRIYLVADFASERAGEILFECEGVQGDSAEGVQAREEPAVHAAGSAVGGDGTGGNVTCYAIGSYASNAWKSPNPDSGVYVTEVAKTLDLNGGNPSCNQGGTCVVAMDCRNMVGNVELSGTLQAKNGGGFSLNFVNPVVYDTTQITSPMNYSKPKPGDPCHPLAAQQHPSLMVCVGNGQMNQISMAEQSNTLDCMHDQQIILSEQKKQKRRYIIRRLTPLECCRLQGFPDWWEDGVEGSDSARYKMWGNGIALPCAVDVLRRIAKEMEDTNGHQTD